MLPRLDMTCLC